VTDSIVIEGVGGGTITVSGAVLDRLVRRAAEEVAGVTVRKRGTSVKEERVAVSLTVRYGEVLPAAAEAVQQRVAEALRSACEVEPAVDVVVEELA
jgi:uncharacterized alkaline shock family protein YloU